jgi:preprotein translocase subunit YajC
MESTMFETPAYAQAAGGAAAAGGTAALIGFLPYLAIFAIFYFLIIRPQQNRVKQHRAMVDAVKKGDDVVTGGGILGKAVKVTDTEVEVEAGPNVRFTVLKSTLADVKVRGTAVAANDKV